MISRKTFTKLFLSQANKSTNKASVTLHMQKWWHNRRSKTKGGLRLSDEGYEFLVKDLKLQEHEVPILEQLELSPSVIVFLDHYMESPYYLTRKCLIVFLEKEAFKLHLFSHDIRMLGIVKAMKNREEYLRD